MPDQNTNPNLASCFGCGATIADAPGNYYCGACVTRQLAQADREREAFDAYHAFADRIARGEMS